jgi:hypothetical protein
VCKTEAYCMLCTAERFHIIDYPHLSYERKIRYCYPLYISLTLLAIHHILLFHTNRRSFSCLELIDQVLEQDDIDKDGYLSYIEYVVGRQKDEHKIKSKYKKT